MSGLQPTYIDVTNTLQARSITGIQRVTSEILRRPRTARIRGFDPIPVTRDAIGWRRLTAAEHDRLHLGPAPARGVIRRGVERSPFAGALSSLRGWVPGRPARSPQRSVASVPSHLRSPLFQPGSLFFDCEASWHNLPARAELLPRLRHAGVGTAMLGFDALPFERPEWFVPVIGQQFRDHVAAHLQVGSFVVCISEDTRSRLATVADDLGAPPMEGAVMPLGSDWPAPVDPVAPPGVPDRFVLCVGTVEPRKNHGMLLDAWERIEAPGSRRLQGSVGLVVVGRLGWQSDELARRLRRLHRSDRRVQWLRSVDDAQLAALYRDASALVMPSLDEGLGLPVLEARHNAVPVLASNRGGLPEALGGGGILLDPDDVDGWARAMTSMLDDEVRRQMVVRASAADPPPTWDAATNRLWSLTRRSLMRNAAAPI